MFQIGWFLSTSRGLRNAINLKFALESMRHFLIFKNYFPYSIIDEIRSVCGMSIQNSQEQASYLDSRRGEDFHLETFLMDGE